MREKARHDHTFTEDIIAKLFCNMEQLHALHQSLLQDIKVVGENPSYHSTVARTYAKHVSGRGLLGTNSADTCPLNVVLCDCNNKSKPGMLAL